MTLLYKIKATTKRFTVGEGPHWDAETQSLYFVDVLNENFHKIRENDNTVHTCKFKGSPISFIIPVKDKRNHFVVGHGRNIVQVEWNGENSEAPISTVNLCELSGSISERFNDGKCDSFGRLFTGTMDEKKIGDVEKNKGSLFSFDSNTKELKCLVTNISVSNGLDWDTMKKRFYYIDSYAYGVYQFDYDSSSGMISNQKIIFDFKEHGIPGLPDGMCIDAENKLWVACFNGSRVIRIDPNKNKLLQTILLPAKQITSVAFGGSNLDVLYVTSAAIAEESSNPEAGKIYVISNLNVQGTIANKFKL